MAEIKQVPGYPQYGITRDGRVWSFRREKWLVSHRTSNGKYLMVKLGTARHALVHRLVLETFVGSCPDGMQCCHNDGNSLSNRIENLRWDTHANNAKDSVKHGTCSLLIGNRHFRSLHGMELPQSRLTDQKARQIVYEHGTGMFSNSQIAEHFGVSHTMIGRIVNHKAWTHIWLRS